MARKRSKSKARRKSKARSRRRKELVRSTSGATTAVPLDEEKELILDDLEEDEPLTLDLSDDPLDDPDERERLISAAAGLTIETEGPLDADADVPEPSAQAPDRAAPAMTPGVPAMTPAALAALSEIHHEGLASLPAEFVLDLGEATTDVQRDRILAAATAHADMQEAIYRVPTEEDRSGSWKGLLAASLLVAALLTLARPPAFVVPPSAPAVEVADRVRGVQLALLLQVEQIEAFRSREGRLPESLDDLDHVVPGVRFVRSSNRLYQLVAFGPDGRAVVYDSAAPGAEFEGIDRPWTASEGTAS